MAHTNTTEPFAIAEARRTIRRFQRAEQTDFNRAGVRYWKRVLRNEQRKLADDSIEQALARARAAGF